MEGAGSHGPLGHSARLAPSPLGGTRGSRARWSLSVLIKQLIWKKMKMKVQCVRGQAERPSPDTFLTASQDPPLLSCLTQPPGKVCTDFLRFPQNLQDLLLVRSPLRGRATSRPRFPTGGASWNFKTWYLSGSLINATKINLRGNLVFLAEFIFRSTLAKNMFSGKYSVSAVSPASVGWRASPEVTPTASARDLT